MLELVKRMMLIGFLVSAALIGCEKDQVLLKEDVTTEKESVRSTYSNFVQTSVIGVPPPYDAPVPGAVPLYEYASSNSTENKRELTTIYYSSYPGYTYKGIFGFVFTSATAGAVPLYGYKNIITGNIYYSTFLYDAPIPDYEYEEMGVICYVYEAQVSKTLPVYAFYWNIQGHATYLYTNILGSRDAKEPNGPLFYILQNKQSTTYPLPEEDCAELYRYYNAFTGDHLYTTSKANYSGYVYETILGYISTIQKPGTVPLYRYWSASDTDHYYPLVRQNYTGYVYEGIVGYVYPTSGVSGTAPVYSYYSDGDGDHYYEMLNSNFSGYFNEGIRFYMLQYNH